MGKLWRKGSSYVRVEEDQPRCIWTVFQMFNYHPSHTFKKRLPYQKHKFHDKSTKSKGIKPVDEHEIKHSQDIEENFVLKHSASVDNTGSLRDGSGSKRSITARIKGLIKNINSSRELGLVVQEPEFQGLKNKCDDDDDVCAAPTLMSLLKANPKLTRSIKHVDESSNINLGARANNNGPKMEDGHVGVLELFKVDHDLFLRLSQNSPPRKLTLVKCGTFPSPNGMNSSNFERRPTKVEDKFNEAWPVSGDARVLQKAKSQSIARSSSITDYSLDKFAYLFDSSSHKAIKKHLSKSLKLRNEKEFPLLNDLQGQRSFKERSYLSESEFHSFTSNEPSRVSPERWNDTSSGEMRGLRLDSPREIESLAESQSKEKTNSFIAELKQSIEEHFVATTDSSREVNLDVCSQKDETENVEFSISEGSPLASYRTFTFSRSMKENTLDKNDQFSVDYCNEDLQYVNYVFDIVGFTTAQNQREDWHSQTQPLDPALFDGIEVCCPYEPKSSNNDAICMSSSHRKLVFDLINEALLVIHERSYVHYPKALSSRCHVWPTTTGNNRGVVWEFVREYLSWRPELDPTLDIAMSHDLAKDKNNWVNLQADTESLALELEDMILNHLLEEIICY